MPTIKLADARSQPAVQAFNQRLAAGGSTWAFYENPTPRWLPRVDGSPVFREHYLLQEDDGTVRGGYVLKHEIFLLDGEPVTVAHQQGPVAESVVDSTFRGLGFKMVDDSLQKRPLQTGWGATIRKGWEAETRPALLYVANKTAFLRSFQGLQRRNVLGTVGRLSTRLGLSQVGLSVAQLRVPGTRATVTEEARFGPWADDVWLAAKGAYKLLAVRDAATLNQVMPPDDFPGTIPLGVRLGGNVVGWAAIRDHRLSGDPQFGDLRAGSMVDALAIPGHERTVIEAATRHLVNRGVDFVGSFFSHPTWIRGFQQSGYLTIPNRRGFGFSPELIRIGGGLQALSAGTHLTLIDADGPRVF